MLNLHAEPNPRARGLMPQKNWNAAQAAAMRKRNRSNHEYADRIKPIQTLRVHDVPILDEDADLLSIPTDPVSVDFR